jgi:hypothetical protein
MRERERNEFDYISRICYMHLHCNNINLIYYSFNAIYRNFYHCIVIKKFKKLKLMIEFFGRILLNQYNKYTLFFSKPLTCKALVICVHFFLFSISCFFYSQLLAIPSGKLKPPIFPFRNRMLFLLETPCFFLILFEGRIPLNLCNDVK